VQFPKGSRNLESTMATFPNGVGGKPQGRASQLQLTIPAGNANNRQLLPDNRNRGLPVLGKCKAGLSRGIRL